MVRFPGRPFEDRPARGTERHLRTTAARPVRMLGASADTFLLGTTVAAATVLSVLFAAQSSVLADRVPNAIVRGVYIASWGAVGILLWRQRPESRLGPLFIALSWIYGLTALLA